MVEDGTTEKDDIPPMPSTRYHQRREKAADAEDQRKGPGASEDSGQEELGSVAMLETANPTEARPTVRSSADVQQAAGKEGGEGAMGQMDNVVRPGAVAVSGIGVELNASSPAAVSERNESVVEVVHATLVEELPPVPIDAEVGYAHAQPARGDPTCSLRSRKVLVCIALAVGAIIGLAFGLGFALIDGDGAGLGDSGSAAADTPPTPIVPSPAPGPTSTPPFPQSQPQSQPQPQPQPRPTPPAPTAQLATGPQWNPLGADISYDFFFGLSVAISADGFTVAAGAPLGGGRERGQVLVHRLDPATGGWAPLGRPVNGLWPFSELGESADLSADGSVLAVGAPLAGEERGHVRVLDYDAERDEWVQRGSLLDGEEEEDLAGVTVSLSADGLSVAVGSPQHSSGPFWEGAGQARLFAWEGDEWVEVGDAIGDEFSESSEGLALSADGERVVVGAPSPDGRGFVRVFQRDDAGREDDRGLRQVGEDIMEGGREDAFGRSVAANRDGSIIAVGAPMFDSGRRGEVRALQWNGALSQWEPRGQTLQGDFGTTLFGWSVALSDDGSVLAAASADIEGDFFSFRGYIKVFRFDEGGSEWVQMGATLSEAGARNDGFGISIDLSSDGTVLITGSPRSNDGEGHVSVYRLE